MDMKLSPVHFSHINFGNNKYDVQKQKARQEIVKKFIDSKSNHDLMNIVHGYVGLKQKYINIGNSHKSCDQNMATKFVEAVESMLENYSAADLIIERDHTSKFGLSLPFWKHSDSNYKAERYQAIMDYFSRLVAPKYFQEEPIKKAEEFDINRAGEFQVVDLEDVGNNRFSTYLTIPEDCEIEESDNYEVDWGPFMNIYEKESVDHIEITEEKTKSPEPKNLQAPSLSEYFIVGNLNEVPFSEPNDQQKYSNEIVKQMTKMISPFMKFSKFSSDEEAIQDQWDKKTISKPEYQSLIKELKERKNQYVLDVLHEYDIPEKLDKIMKHLHFIANSKSNKKNRVEELQEHIIAFNSAYKMQMPFGDTRYLSILVQPKLVLGDSGRVFLHWEVSSFDGKFSDRETEILLSKKENIIVLPNNNSKSIDNIEHTFSIGRLFAPHADETMIFIDYAGKGMNLALNFDDEKQKLSINDQAESVLAVIRSKQDKVLSFYSHSFGGMVLSLTLRHVIDNDLRINKIIANGFAKDKNSMAHSKAGKLYKFFEP